MMCECGHDLGAHPPDPNRPFAWSCRICGCSEYREKSSDLIYILGSASRAYTMSYVRVSLQNGRARVYEGLTNR